MRAILFKAGTLRPVLVTNADRDITFGGDTYVADRSFIRLSGPTDRTGFPGYQFEIVCAAGTNQRRYFLSSPGPEPVLITEVKGSFDQGGNLVWTKFWDFQGVLGAGQLVDDLYSGETIHTIEHLLSAPPRRYWNHTEQQARDSTDKGCEHVSTVKQPPDWRGIRMRHDAEVDR